MPTEWTGATRRGCCPCSRHGPTRCSRHERRAPAARGAGPGATPLPEGPTEGAGSWVAACMCHVWAVRGGVRTPTTAPHTARALQCPACPITTASTACTLPTLPGDRVRCLCSAPSCPNTRPCQCTAYPCCPQHYPGTAHSLPVPAHGEGCCLHILLLVPCQGTAHPARTLPTLPAHCLGIAAHPARALPTHVPLSRQERCSGYGACTLPAHAER